MADLYEKNNGKVEKKVIISKTYKYEPFEIPTTYYYNEYLTNNGMVLNNLFKSSDSQSASYYIPYYFNSGTNTTDLNFVRYSYSNKYQPNGYSTLNTNVLYNNHYCIFNFQDLCSQFNQQHLTSGLFSQDQNERGWSAMELYDGPSTISPPPCFNAMLNQSNFFQTRIYQAGNLFRVKAEKLNGSSNLTITTNTNSYSATDFKISSPVNTTFKLGYQMIISAQAGLESYINSAKSSNFPFWKKYFAVSVKGGYESSETYNVSNSQSVKLCTFDETLPYHITCKKLNNFMYYVEDMDFKTYNLYPHNNEYQTYINIPIFETLSTANWCFDNNVFTIVLNSGGKNYNYKGPTKSADIDPNQISNYWFDSTELNAIRYISSNNQTVYIDNNKNWTPYLSSTKFDTTAGLLSDAYDMGIVKFLITGISGSDTVYYISGDGTGRWDWTASSGSNYIHYYDTETEVRNQISNLDTSVCARVHAGSACKLKDEYIYEDFALYSATVWTEAGAGSDHLETLTYLGQNGYANARTNYHGNYTILTSTDFNNKNITNVLCDMPQVKCVALNYFITEL